MSDLIWITEVHGSNILVNAGGLLTVVAILAVIAKPSTSQPRTFRSSPIWMGVLAGSVSLLLSGVVTGLVFDGHTGVERVIGNLFVWSTAIFSLGIGARTTQMITGYPEHK